MKKLKWIVIVCLCLILAVGIGLFAWIDNSGTTSGSGKTSKSSKSDASTYAAGYYWPKDIILINNETGDLFCNNRLIFKHGDFWDMDHSIDGSVAAFSDNRTLYLASDYNSTALTHNCSSLKLSVFGDAVAYETNDGQLHVYNRTTKETTTYTVGHNDFNYDISPDGKTLVYSDSRNNCLMLCKNGNQTKLADGFFYVEALSNDGQLIYLARSYDSDLVCRDSSGNLTQLNQNAYSRLYFNADHTQAIFQSDSKTYISTNGKPSIKISDEELELMLPGELYKMRLNDYPVEDLYGQVYRSNRAVWLIEKAAENCCQLVSDTRSVSMDSSGQYLYYRSDDQLRYLKINDRENAAKNSVTILDEIANAVILSYNRRYVYYVVETSLYRVNVKTGGEAIKITDAIPSDYRFNPYYALTADEKGLYYCTSEGVYYFDGSESQLIHSGNACQIMNFGGNVYLADGEQCYYINKSHQVTPLS